MAEPKSAAARPPVEPPRAVTVKDPPGPPRAALVLLYGPAIGRRYDLEPRSMTIGRSTECDITVDLDSVSPRHCTVTLTDRGVRVKDGESSGGTLINDQRIDQATLRHGDRLSVGRAVFRCLIGNETLLEAEYHQQIYDLACRDPLTDTFNKRFFTLQLNKDVGHAQREAKVLSVALMDLDHFKRINDRHGHTVGDQLLRDLGALLRAWTRPTEFVARYGGEEFAIVLRDTPLPAAHDRLEALRNQIEATEFTDLPLTASIGLATLTPDDDSNTFLQRADDNLHQAKLAGRNQTKGS